MLGFFWDRPSTFHKIIMICIIEHTTNSNIHLKYAKLKAGKSKFKNVECLNFIQKPLEIQF